MRFTTSVAKKDVGLTTNGAATNAPMTPQARRQAIKIAVDRALASFNAADLCPIQCVEFVEFSDRDLSAARITLDIGGSGYGGDLE